MKYFNIAAEMDNNHQGSTNTSEDDLIFSDSMSSAFYSIFGDTHLRKK